MTDSPGHYHDPLGKYDYCDDPNCPRTGSPYVADPGNPTDAELAAAIERGLADGSLITADEFLARAREAAPDECAVCVPGQCPGPGCPGNRN